MAQPWEVPGPLRDSFEAAEGRWLSHWRRGPTRTTWTVLPPQRGAAAPNLDLFDLTGKAVPTAGLWSRRPALLLFWRHWGCGCGVRRAELLERQLPKLLEAGANVVVVGQGEPGRASWYKEAFGVPVPILVDPTGAVYEAFGLLEMSPWLLIGEANPPMAEIESWIGQHRVKGRPVADNPFLLPGEFVVDTRGRLVLTYRYQYCDNYPDVESLVDSINEAGLESAL
jgi:peroxiredoxin